MMIFSFSSVTDFGFDFIGHNLIICLILRESTMWTMNRMLTGRQAGLFENVSKTSSPFDLRSTSYLTFVNFFYAIAFSCQEIVHFKVNKFAKKVVSRQNCV